MANKSTTEDPNATGWAITDPVVRFRELGRERVFGLAASHCWVLGASPDCSIQLDDPSGRVSRQHALAVRENEVWTMYDNSSTNGVKLNGEARRSFQFAAGDEIKLGGVSLLAESHRSIELHDLLRRWLGWSTSRLLEVDQALLAVREMANLRAALILRGAGDLVGVARRLHRLALGNRPFAMLDSDEDGLQGLDRAINGMLCVKAHKLSRDIRLVIANLCKPDTRVRLVVYADSPESAAEIGTMITRIVTVSIPPIKERADELDRLLTAYGFDAVEEFGTNTLGFRPRDPEWIRARPPKDLHEIEDVARRLVALRNYGVTKGADRLKLTHGALSRWARRRKLPT